MKDINQDDLFNRMLSMISMSIRGNNDMGIVEFAEDVLFNGQYTLYPQQRAILRAFYNEELTESDKTILSEWLGLDRTTWVEGRHYINLVLEAGRRGSKSTIASIIALKEFYDLITLESPAKTYGILPNDPIAIFVISQSQDQAKETIFAKIKGYAEGSMYFKGLQDSGIIEILSEEVRCPAKNIGIYAKHTNSRALVGYSLKCMILDEAARFETSKETGTNGADLMWDNVGKGTSAFQSHGRKVAISSAWEIGDPIERLYLASQTDANSLGFRLSTFQLNPTMSKDRTQVIVSDYAKDYISARLEYEGIRSSKHNTFLSRTNVEKACTGPSAFDARGVDLDLEVNGDRREYVGIQIDRLFSDVSLHSFIHVDPALKKDSAALAISRSVKLEDGRWGIQIDGVLKWQPRTDQKGIKRVVSFTDIEDKLLLLCRSRGVKKVTFDSFNSASLIQKLHMQGIPTAEISSSREKQLLYYTLLRDLLNQNLLIFPKDSTWTGDIKAELSELVLKPNKQIVHPYAGKDIADAICLAVYNCYNYQVQSGIVSGVMGSVTKVSNSNTRKLQTPNDLKRVLKMGNAIGKVRKGL
jgi:hypothetical protein